MSSIQDAGRMFQALSAGLQGKGSEWQTNQLQQQQLQKKNQAEEETKRRKNIALDSFRALEMIKRGDWSSVVNMGSTMVDTAESMGQPIDDIAGLTIMAERARGGDTEAANNVQNTLRLNVESAFLDGTLQRPPSTKKGFEQFKDGQMITGSPEQGYTSHEIKGFTPEAGDANSEEFTFGSTQTLKDSQGRLFTQTQQRSKYGGRVKSVVKAIDGSQAKPKGKLNVAGTYGLTAGEKVDQISQETSAKKIAELGTTELTNIKKTGIAAKQLMTKTNQLLKLNEMINTGKTAGAKKYFMDLFNIDSEAAANLGEFNAKSGQMVLGMIRQLGANPTEGERAFLTEINAGISQGKAVNRAILKDLLKVQQRQVERARAIVDKGITDLDDLLLLETEDFESSSSFDTNVTSATTNTQAPASGGFKLISVE